AAGLGAMHADGVSVVVSTPHVDGSLTARRDALAARLDVLDTGWQQLQQVAAGFANIRVHRGAEIMLDTPEPDLSHPSLRLAGSRFVLVEFPYLTVPPRSAWALEQLVAAGWLPIVAHPERYMGSDPELDRIGEWQQTGALLQVNGASLPGRYGPRARALPF